MFAEKQEYQGNVTAGLTRQSTAPPARRAINCFPLNHAEGTRAFFASLLEWARAKPLAQVSEPGLQARLHTGPGGNYLWVVNPTRTARTVTVTLDPALTGSFRRGEELWQTGTPAVKVSGNQVQLTIQDRNAAVIHLE